MLIKTVYGDVEIGEPKECECNLYVDWDLEKIPEKLQKHIDEVVRDGKRRAFEQRKTKHLENGYRTLEEFERDCPIKIAEPYLGIRLDTRENELNASLHINGYDCAEKGIWIEFHHRESVAISPDVLLELLLTAIKKATPSEQTMEPIAEDY